MGRHQRAIRMRDQQGDQGNKQRRHRRQAWTLRQDKSRLILRHGAGPIHEGVRFDSAMVARILIAPGVQVKAASGWLL